MSTVSKGKGYEREIRRALLDAGFPARRTPRSGATAWAKGDIEFLPRVNAGMLTAEEYAKKNGLWFELDRDTRSLISRHNIKRIECKRKKKLPSWLTDCLEYDVAVLREDRGETVVVMNLKTWLELMR